MNETPTAPESTEDTSAPDSLEHYLVQHHERDCASLLAEFLKATRQFIARPPRIGEDPAEKAVRTLNMIEKLAKHTVTNLDVLKANLRENRQKPDEDIWKFCRTERPTADAVQRLRDRVDRANLEECGVDVDCDRYVQVLVVDRHEQEPLHFQPIPRFDPDRYAEDPGLEYQDQVDVVRAASMNAAIANDSLNRELGWLLSLENKKRHPDQLQSTHVI